MSSINYNPKHYQLDKFIGMSKQNPQEEVWNVIIGEYSDSGGCGDLVEMMTLSKYCELTGKDIKKLRLCSDSNNINDYEIKTLSKVDADDNVYWTAFSPKIDGIVGGGNTEAEALDEIKENLIYLWERENM